MTHRRINPLAALAYAAFTSAAAVGYALYTAPDDAETLNTLIPFADIPAKGDKRLQSIIATIRQSPEGEALYQHAASTGAVFEWRPRNPLAPLGTYESGLTTMQADHTKSRTVLAVVHELYHHWQGETLKPHQWKLDPVDRYHLAQMVEVDACAKTAIFAAAHADATGKALPRIQNAQSAFGDKIAEDYARRSKTTRLYLHDTYEQCFAEINSPVFHQYQKTHLSIMARPAHAAFDALQKSDEKDLETVFNTHFKTATLAEKARLFRSFFVTDIKTGTIHPDIAAMDDADFMGWIETQSRSAEKAPVQETQNAFNYYRQVIKSFIPAPTPGS